MTLGTGGTPASEEQPLAVGLVTAVSEDRVRVRLGRNERVPGDARARPTDAPTTGSTFAPPRVAGLWEAAFMVRPFLTLDAFGFGAVSDLRVTYRDERGFAVHAAVEPLGLGFADEGTVVAGDGTITASYDTRLFELGLGVGVASNDEAQAVERAGLSIRQIGRLGARDGVNLEVRNTFLLFEEVGYESAFRYGATVATATTPLTPRFALFARGGGGVIGFAFGELGLRVLAVGNGDRGSLLIDAALGGAVVRDRDQQCRVEGQGEWAWEQCETVNLGGPMIGLGMEWRR